MSEKQRKIELVFREYKSKKEYENAEKTILYLKYQR